MISNTGVNSMRIRFWTVLTLAWLALGVIGCTAAGTDEGSVVKSTAVDTPAVNQTEAGALEASPPSAQQSKPTFTNPVLDQDFPDPDVLLVDGVYYAYATNSGETNILVSRSTDLVHWTNLPDALPNLPSWASQEFGYAWAPEVFRRAVEPQYVMYFVARFAIGRGGTQCIGVAVSPVPEGPFESPDPEPFICQRDEGGSIDAATFVDDDGQLYVLWKNDGNSITGKTYIYVQKASPDGMTLEGEPTRLITSDQIWEGVLVEAPTLWKNDGRYYLFYSANAYNDRRYAVGYAVADSVLGPYEKSVDPLLKTDLPAGIVGPGGQDIVIGPQGGEWMLYHGWAPGGYRRLYLSPLTWENGTPVVTPDGKNPIPMP